MGGALLPPPIVLLEKPVCRQAWMIRMIALGAMVFSQPVKTPAGASPRPTVGSGNGEWKIKKPRSSLLQGRISDPRYHPAYLPGEIPSDSNKSYPGNGGDRVPLLKATASFTEPTQEPDFDVRPTGSHQPPALWSIKQGRFFLQCLCDVYI